MTETKKHRYVEGVGRRKTAVARVRLMEGKGAASVNGKPVEEYFGTQVLRETAHAAVRDLKLEGVHFTARVRGGGVRAQAEAVRHGLSRAIAQWNKEYVSHLRVLGYLTRDPRMVERKKYGLKKARRRPQWAKR